MERALCAGDHERARALDVEMARVAEWLAEFPRPAGLKAAANLRKLKTGAETASPLTEAKQARMTEFQRWFPEWLADAQKLAGAFVESRQRRCGFALAAGAAAAQGAPQMVRFSASADGSQQTYALYAARDLVVNRRYPLVISLHGEETSPQLNLRQLLGSKILRVDPSDPRMYPVARETGYFAAFPLARGTFGYRGIVERDVYDVLDDVERRNPIDRDRVYLTGIGMGGGGALSYALTRPDLWAAVAPLSPESIPGTEELAGNAIDLPVRLFHGDQDPVAPVAGSRLWQRLLLQAGAPAEYFEFPGVRHNTWDFAYKNGAIFEWFGQFRRQPFPQRVHFSTRWYRYNSAYWVRIDGLTPGQLATIDARQEGAGVRVETKGVDGFTVTLDHTIDAATVDGWTVKMKPGTEQSFTRIDTRWRAGRFTPRDKRPGAEGAHPGGVRWRSGIRVRNAQRSRRRGPGGA